MGAARFGQRGDITACLMIGRSGSTNWRWAGAGSVPVQSADEEATLLRNHRTGWERHGLDDVVREPDEANLDACPTDHPADLAEKPLKPTKSSVPRSLPSWLRSSLSSSPGNWLNLWRRLVRRSGLIPVFTTMPPSGASSAETAEAAVGVRSRLGITSWQSSQPSLSREKPQRRSHQPWPPPSCFLIREQRLA